MSREINEGNRIEAPKDQVESSQNDESSCSRSSLAGGTVLKKGHWSPSEDAILVEYVKKHGEGNWNTIEKRTELRRCGKSCRLRWVNHLKPGLKKGAFSREESEKIVQLQCKLGSKWSKIAAMIPGRTDNEIKNYWHTRAKRYQRTCLPHYPQHVLLQALDENQQTLNYSMSNREDKGLGIVLQSAMHDSAKFFKASPGPQAYSPPFSDISFTGLQNQDLVSHTYSFNPGVNHAIQLRETESYFPGNHGSMASGHAMFEQLPHGPNPVNKNVPSFGYSEPGSFIQPNVNFSTSSPPTRTMKLELPSLQYPETDCYSRLACLPPLPYGPDPVNKNVPSFGYSEPGSFIQPNVNFSTSSPPTRTMKLELPSLQYPETDCYSRLACPPPLPCEAIRTSIQSPPMVVSTQPGYASQSSGLSETLVQLSHATSTVGKQSSEKWSNYSAISPIDILENSSPNMCSADWKGSSDPNSPFSLPEVSPFSECLPIDDISFDDFLDSEATLGLEKTEPNAEQMPTPGVVEKDVSDGPNVQRPDALFGSDWCAGGSRESQW